MQKRLLTTAILLTIPLFAIYVLKQKEAVEAPAPPPPAVVINPFTPIDPPKEATYDEALASISAENIKKMVY